MTSGAGRGTSPAGAMYQPWTERPSTSTQRSTGLTRSISARASALRSVSRRGVAKSLPEPAAGTSSVQMSVGFVGVERAYAMRVPESAPAPPPDLPALGRVT